MATSDTFDPILAPNPTQYDVHVYQTPGMFKVYIYIINWETNCASQVGLPRILSFTTVSRRASRIHVLS